MIKSQVKTHGVLEQHVLQNQEDAVLESFVRKGFSIIKNVLDIDQVASIKKNLYDIYNTQCQEVGGEEKLIAINEKNVVRSMFTYDNLFLNEVLLNNKLEPYVKVLLDGSYTLYSQVGIISEPQNELYQTRWHREIQYQHFTSSRPIAVQTIFALDSFNSTTGGTFFLPYSHLFDKFPSDAFVLENETQPVLEPGDVVLMNSMLYHRAGFNTSNSDRLLITNTFTRPIFASQYNYKLMMNLFDNNYPLNVREVLGGRWDYSKSMLEWRLERIEKSTI
jgi:ectoine hydroxylase-related dioxygenase (phytanoyl-CoA dioxygenase family)